MKITKISTIILSIMMFSFIGISSSKLNLNSKGHLSKKCQLKKLDINGGEVFVIKIFKNNMNYKVNNNNSGDVDFYLNSNFFTNTNPIGEVIINNKTINKSVKGGGYFTSDGGQPTISLYNRPNSEYSTQTKYIGIKNGKLNTNMFVSKLSKWKTYRTLLGKDLNGDLILVHSGRNGILNIEEISKIGKSEGMYNALIFDGGSSIEVYLKDGNFEHRYHSVSDTQKKLQKIHKPFVYITGKFI